MTVQHRLGQIRVQARDDLDIAGAQLVLHELNGALDEGIDVGKPALRRMKPGEVEQVLDNSLAALCALEDQLEVPVLVRVAGCLGEQLRESHDGGERIVQLM